MYARVTTAQYQNAGAIDEGAQIYRDSILPSTQQLKGFKDVITLGDRSTGKAMVVTFWETEADAQAQPLLVALFGSNRQSSPTFYPALPLLSQKSSRSVL